MTAEHQPVTPGDPWVDRDVAVVWHGFTQMSAYPTNTPVTVERAEGRELIDVHGNRYFDAISSLWVTTLGHRVPELDAAVVDQLGKVAHATLLGNGSRASSSSPRPWPRSCRWTTPTRSSPRTGPWPSSRP